MSENENMSSDKPLALEILEEVKTQSKRWMVAFFAVLGLWAATIAGFVLYLYQYDFITYDQSEGIYNNINTGEQGDVINGSETPTKNTEER